LAQIKYTLIVTTIACQVLLFVSLFAYPGWIRGSIIGYVSSIAILLGILVWERRKEKREEDGNDYSDY